MDFFIRDNLFEGHDALTRDNTQFFNFVEKQGQRLVTTTDQPFAAPPVTTLPARDALEAVLATVGASLPVRDAVDVRLVDHVRTRSGKIIDSQTEVGGWPELKPGTLPADTDNDGIPDAWESAHGLNPHNASDASAIARSGYTNIEEYLNSISTNR